MEHFLFSHLKRAGDFGRANASLSKLWVMVSEHLPLSFLYNSLIIASFCDAGSFFCILQLINLSPTVDKKILLRTYAFLMAKIIKSHINGQRHKQKFPKHHCSLIRI